VPTAFPRTTSTPSKPSRITTATYGPRRARDHALAQGAPRESLRLCTVAREALRREGIAAPERHFVVYSAKNVATIVMKREPFTSQEVSDFVREGERRGLAILYDPSRRVRTCSRHSSRHPTARRSTAPCRSTSPRSRTTSPFFFLQHRWKDLSPRRSSSRARARGIPGKLLLLLVLGISLGLSIVLLLLPLFLKSRTGLSRPGSFRLLLYFFGVGVAYMMIEILLMQEFSLFLGHPVYAISLVLFSLLIFSGAGSLASRS